MKTIQVNGETWEEIDIRSCGYHGWPNFLKVDEKFYIPQKKEITLDELIEEYEKTTVKLISIKDKHIEKIAAVRHMITVADYLNEGWEPDWNDYNESKYMIEYSYSALIPSIHSTTSFAESICYFKDSETAKRAIKILGEETIKAALS